MSIYTTDNMVEDLVKSIGSKATDAQIHWLREALNGLVRQAKIEQLVQIRLDTKKSIGTTIIK